MLLSCKVRLPCVAATQLQSPPALCGSYSAAKSACPVWQLLSCKVRLPCVAATQLQSPPALCGSYSATESACPVWQLLSYRVRLPCVAATQLQSPPALCGSYSAAESACPVWQLLSCRVARWRVRWLHFSRLRLLGSAVLMTVCIDGSMWTPRFLMQCDDETVSSPIVKEQPPYTLKWCFDVKIIVLVFHRLISACAPPSIVWFPQYSRWVALQFPLGRLV